jgi:hypothetical protein
MDKRTNIKCKDVVFGILFAGKTITFCNNGEQCSTGALCYYNLTKNRYNCIVQRIRRTFKALWHQTEVTTPP